MNFKLSHLNDVYGPYSLDMSACTACMVFQPHCVIANCEAVKQSRATIENAPE
ncbi:MAG: hypothetical protein LBG45_06235 [Dysgonamonadaceae bacterium]|nr:hypothetical protein [Dysgonamonadaceae bacterium]